MVFQDFRLVPALTRARERRARRAPDPGPLLRRREIAARLAEVAEALGLAVDLDAPLRTLPIAQQQQVEIAKVLVAGAKILILDEPTSVLAPQEADGLFAQMDELRSRGFSILMITHKLREARQVADRLTVLRGGRSVARGRRCPTRWTTPSSSRRWSACASRRCPPSGRRPRSRAASSRFAASGCPGQAAARGCARSTCTSHGGEVVGIAGVAGSGQRELADAVAGALHWHAGRDRRRRQGAAPRRPARRARAPASSAVPEDPVRQWVVRGHERPRAHRASRT